MINHILPEVPKNYYDGIPAMPDTSPKGLLGQIRMNAGDVGGVPYKAKEKWKEAIDNIKLDDEGSRFITNYEKFRQRAYKASPNEKYWTYGYGMLTKNPNATITEPEARKMYNKTIEHFSKRISPELYIMVDGKKQAYNQDMYNAMLSLAYNRGVGGSRQVRRLLMQGKVDDAVNKWKSYVHAGGRKLRGLERRRNAELEIFKKGYEDLRMRIQEQRRRKVMMGMGYSSLMPTDINIKQQPVNNIQSYWNIKG